MKSYEEMAKSVFRRRDEYKNEVKKKRGKTLIGIVSGCLAFIILLNIGGDVATTVHATDLMEGITPNEVTALSDLSSQNGDVTDFAVRLFKASAEKDKNTLISPLSVLCALSMTANGAEGETKKQMEEVLGMTTDELNLYIYSYMKNLPQGEKYKLSLANSIWFTEDARFNVNPDFLQTNADYYGADIYKAPFDDRTCKNINDWVKQNTDGMIEEILDEIPCAAVMYLINALAFDAEWSTIYEEDQVRDGTFTKEDGTKQTVEFMYCSEFNYLEDENATGFIKYYKGNKYAFAALLPSEDVSIEEYIASLDGDSLKAMLCNPVNTKVLTSIPKFETEFNIEMSGVLAQMGMGKAFDPYTAEFSGLGTSDAGNIYIDRVLHKTYISVGEKGTKAGAATVIEMLDEVDVDMQPNKPEPKKVYLDRPFVYMLIDCENNIPFFMGTTMSVE